MESHSQGLAHCGRRPLSYILITSARNEEQLIEQTIVAVTSQTMLPLRWVIVSDGSTDRTDEIVLSYSRTCSWIEFIRMPEHQDHSFASKVYCFNKAYARIANEEFDIIGNLDADITFKPDYFEFLLSKFAANLKLGVAGTPFVEGKTYYDYRYTNIEHVSGACQLFRRECFTDIGGYSPVREGGIDWIAVTTARMRGWATRTFLEKKCYHHRKIGTGSASPTVAIFRYGVKNYILGNHPLWQALRTLHIMKKPPYVIGGLLLYSGYIWAFLQRRRRPISQELMAFYRQEQMSSLKKIFSRLLG